MEVKQYFEAESELETQPQKQASPHALLLVIEQLEVSPLRVRVQVTPLGHGRHVPLFRTVPPVCHCGTPCPLLSRVSVK